MPCNFVHRSCEFPPISSKMNDANLLMLDCSAKSMEVSRPFPLSSSKNSSLISPTKAILNVSIAFEHKLVFAKVHCQRIKSNVLKLLVIKFIVLHLAVVNVKNNRFPKCGPQRRLYAIECDELFRRFRLLQH